MNVKAMMFAGGGLMLSMVVTTMWVGHDMAQIKERQKAKEQAACAAATAAAPAPAAAATGSSEFQAAGTATAAPASATAVSACATIPAATTGAGTPAGQADMTIPGEVDPVTGQVLDPAASSGQSFDQAEPSAATMDPNTGDSFDANADASGDPNAGQTTAPGAGLPIDGASSEGSFQDPAGSTVSNGSGI